MITKTTGTDTTAYSYDGVGNLIWSGVSGIGGLVTEYTYNQRHLLLSQAQGDLILPMLQAEFVYDGNGDRVQQRTKENYQWITTTYINDALGLTQVLLADDGTTTTANLFGLDLILQQEDDGNPLTASAPLYLLTDGLGSVRIEMVGGEATATTSYAPYGEVLSQSGTSHTSYGYTGEQYDQTTGLLYLRARYYNPNSKVFLSRDPYQGLMSRPSTQHGYSYVSNNPINRIDPSGYCEEIADESCWSLYEQIIRKYPEAKNKMYFYNGQWVSLDKLSWSRLNNLSRELNHASFDYFTSNHDVLKSMNFTNADGISFATEISPGTQGPQVNGVGALEYLYNLHTGRLTLFAVVGFSRGGGVGETIDITTSLVYNLGNNGLDNLSYAGDSASITGNFAKVIGLAGGYSWVPEEGGIFKDPNTPYAVSLGCAVGVGGSLTLATTEYIPLVTTNFRKIEQPEFHTYDYLYDPRSNNGSVTGFYKEVRNFYEAVSERLEELIP